MVMICLHMVDIVLIGMKLMGYAYSKSGMVKIVKQASKYTTVIGPANTSQVV